MRDTYIRLLPCSIVAISALTLSQPAAAQGDPIRIGFLTVRTGPLAAGGKQMEEGILLFLKERNNTLAGRRVERKGAKLVNTVVKTYPQVSQFWTYDPKAFLAAPVYSRDFPPSKNLEP